MGKYLIWRFNSDPYVRNRYGMYCDEWINGITDEQMYYFRLEKERLTRMGIYKD